MSFFGEAPLRFCFCLGLLAGVTICGVTRAAPTECVGNTIGIDPALANNSAVAHYSGVGQTFLAADTLVRSLTVWRVHIQDIWAIGIKPYIMETDSAGMPIAERIVAVGPTMVLNGDGIHPVEFKWTFDPPAMLPRPGTYAFMLFQRPCLAYFDVLAAVSSDGSTYPQGTLVATGRTYSCTPEPWMQTYPTGDLVFQIEFCRDAVTDIRTRSWGGIKSRYRPGGESNR